MTRLVEGFHGMAFGMVDGLIALLGVVIGVASATNSSEIVILSGVVVGLTNAFGNSIGFYASELAEQGEHLQENMEVSSWAEVKRSTVLAFIASLFSVLVLVPPFLFMSTKSAMILSVITSTLLLYALGSLVGRYSKRSSLKYGFTYVLLGLAGAGFAYMIGTAVGILISA